MCWKKLDNSVQRVAAQSVFFPAAFAFFHLALAAAAFCARAAALIFRMGFLPDVSILDCGGGLVLELALGHRIGRASGPCRNFRPHSAPEISPTSGRSERAACLTPARHPPGDSPRLTRSPEVGIPQPRAPTKASSLRASFSLDTDGSARHHLRL